MPTGLETSRRPNSKTLGDLVGRELGARFEAVVAGPDGGMDGRHAKGDAGIILQAKHYAGSTHAALKSEIKRERSSIDRVAPTRYVLATSRGAHADAEERTRCSERPVSEK